MELDDKVCVVTGAAMGIGASILRRYLEEGASVVAVDLPHQLPDAASLQQRHGERLRYVAGDVSKEQTAIDFVRAALDGFGRLDVMVNNAGVIIVKPIHEHTPEEWDRIFDVNVKALYWSARHCVPVMTKAGGGLFLNTGSISSVTGLPGQGAYCPAKGAVIQVTRQMAIEYGSVGIRANAVCPGSVDTPLLSRAAEESGDPAGFLNGLASGHPIGRIASADEIAEFFVFLASDRARFFTGAILMIDGGYTAR